MDQIAKRVNIIWVIGIYAAVLGVFYGSTLTHDFVYDDIGSIVDNEYTHSLAHVPHAFTTCFWGAAKGWCEGGDVVEYRPFMALAFILTYQISSSPAFFHFMHLVYILGAAALLFLLVQVLGGNKLLAFFAGFLLLIHPLNNEVGNYISAFPEVWYVIFMLLAALFYAKHRMRSVPITRDKNLMAVFLFYVLGLLTKETAFLFPVIAVAFDIFVFRMPLKSLLKAREAAAYAGFAVLFGAYIVMRVFALGGIPDPKPFYQFNVVERVYFFFDLLGKYAAKFLYPYPLVEFHAFSQTVNLASPAFLFGLFAVGGICAAAYIFFKRRQGVPLFFLAWTFILLSPVLIFLNRLGENIFAERYAFGPGIGFAYVASAGLVYLLRHKKQAVRYAAVLACVVLVGLSFALVYPRNGVWRNNETLYAKTIEQNPNAYVIRYYYGVLLGNEKKDFLGARRQFEEIAERNPNWVRIDLVYSNIADVYRMEGNNAGAKEYYLKAVEASGGFNYDALNTLGIMYIQQEEYLQALFYFCRALSLHPSHAGIRGNFERTLAIVQEQRANIPKGLRTMPPTCEGL